MLTNQSLLGNFVVYDDKKEAYNSKSYSWPGWNQTRFSQSYYSGQESLPS